jgi:predicted transcriptional regulator
MLEQTTSNATSRSFRICSASENLSAVRVSNPALSRRMRRVSSRTSSVPKTRTLEFISDHHGIEGDCDVIKQSSACPSCTRPTSRYFREVTKGQIRGEDTTDEYDNEVSPVRILLRMDDLFLQTVKQIAQWVGPYIRVEEVRMEPSIEDVDEPFLLRERTEVEMADYDAGFMAAEAGKEVDETESIAWKRGWAEAQE